VRLFSERGEERAAEAEDEEADAEQDEE